VSITKSTTYELDRAASDYLSVSRRAELFGPQEYERAEARAWERLQAALADRNADTGDASAREGDVAECTGSS
jgi:hypothetical protein